MKMRERNHDKIYLLGAVSLAKRGGKIDEANRAAAETQNELNYFHTRFMNKSERRIFVRKI